MVTKKRVTRKKEEKPKDKPKENPKSKTASISFSYRLDQKEILTVEAKKENRTLSNYIQMVLDKHIASISN